MGNPALTMFGNFFKRIIFKESRGCLEDFLLTVFSELADSSKTTEVFLIEALDCICVVLCCNTLVGCDLIYKIFCHMRFYLILKEFLNLENVPAEVTSWSSCWLLASCSAKAESFKHQQLGKYGRRNFWKLCWNWREFRLKRGLT